MHILLVSNASYDENDFLNYNWKIQKAKQTQGY